MFSKKFDYDAIYELYIVQGFTCKETAEKLGIDKRNLKSYLSFYNLTKDYTHYCKNCGKEFVTRRSDSKFCCTECREKYKSKIYREKYILPKAGIRKCENCSKEYDYNPSMQRTKEGSKKFISAARFCSYECGIEYMNKKMKETNLVKYGAECSLSNKEVHDKAVETWKKKYGVDHMAKAPEVRKKIRDTINKKCEAGYVFKKGYESKLEKEVKSFLESLGFEVHKYIIGKANTRFEIDCYIPSLNVGVEVNGTWWHSLNSPHERTKDYHHKKYLAAKEKGINLIQLWEDRWRNQSELIKNILKIRLKPESISNHILAECCEIKQIDSIEYKEFCNKNYIDGYKKAEVKYGLYNEEKLVQVIGLNRVKEQYEIICNCTALDCLVEKGTSKLLTYFIEDFNPETIIYNINPDLFDSKEYEKFGFNFQEHSKLEHFYIHNDTFERFIRKKSSEKDKLFECYGVGSLKFIWKVDSNV